jgi:2-polyprenyl-3-methyl-5-hydroxy-6-metoxy-1,4-benzoquinol methylase
LIALVRPLLNFPFVYETYHELIGANNRSRVLVEEYIRPRTGDRVLDIGCGPGNMLPFLPACEYMGIDANGSYIEAARKRYGYRAEFHCERVSHHTVQQFGSFDIVLALGLVHHLDDAEARDLFRLGHSALRPGGRMITNDGCYIEGQSVIKRYLLATDRGEFVRTLPEYQALAHTRFAQVKTAIREDVLHIPYTHLIMVCTR